MKKHDIFTFKAPNGVEVTAVVVAGVAREVDYNLQRETKRFICYAQNRLFTYEESYSIWDLMEEEPKSKYGEILIDYCILPDYDSMLERYSDIQVAQAETAMGM